jgi:hypothetical protein
MLLGKRRINEKGYSQNLILFIQRKATSNVPSIKGTSQFQNPTITMGTRLKSPL